MNKIKSYFSLLRPFTLIFPFVSAIFLSALALGYHNKLHEIFDYTIPILCGGFALMLCNSASNCLNQVWDLREDRLHPEKRNRPVANGEISESEALSLAIFGLILVVILCSFVNTLFTIFVGLILLFAFAYSVPPMRLKKRLVLNNLCLSIPRGFLGVLACVSIVAYPFEITFICIGLILFLFAFGVNPVKDISDIEADKKVGIKNLCTVYGVKKAMIISSAFVIIPYFLLVIFPYLKLLPFNTIYLLSLVPIGAVMVWLMFHNPEKKGRTENTTLWGLFYLHAIAYVVGFMVVYTI